TSPVMLAAGRLSAGTAPTYCRSINRSGIASPTLPSSAHSAPQPVTHTHPATQSDWAAPRSNLVQPNATAKSPLSHGTDRADFPPISCLGAFQTPAARAYGGFVTAGVRKPAQNRTFTRIDREMESRAKRPEMLIWPA